jgi:hypothetical protein
MGDPAGDEDEIDGPLARHLVGDVNVAALGIPGLGRHPRTSLALVTPGWRSVDLVVLDGRAALDEQAIVFRVVDRARRVVAGERAHGSHVLPQREGDDLGEVVKRAMKCPCARLPGVERYCSIPV